jgi:Raf kinase inhibitor-like YbhB/YbcL family protein
MPDIPSTDFLFGNETNAKASVADDEPAAAAPGAAAVPGGTGFALRSPEVADGGTLPRDYTGDGTSSTLPLTWSGAPAGTKSFALIMHHIPGPGTVKWYWVLYDIPANVTSLPKNVRDVGILGNNSVNGRTEYAPPHSKGPGPKWYIYTVYALSEEPRLDVPPEQVDRQALLDAMKDHILASAQLRVVYSRPPGATEDDPGAPPPPPPAAGNEIKELP